MLTLVVFRRRSRPAERISPQSDEEFLSQLAPDVPPEQHALALEIRRVIAAFGGFDPKYARADITFDELNIGPADSIDEINLILRLEAILGGELSAHESAQIPSPDLTRQL